VKSEGVRQEGGSGRSRYIRKIVGEEIFDHPHPAVAVQHRAEQIPGNQWDDLCRQPTLQSLDSGIKVVGVHVVAMGARSLIHVAQVYE
jgi:hypothetical protein